MFNKHIGGGLRDMDGYCGRRHIIIVRDARTTYMLSWYRAEGTVQTNDELAMQCIPRTGIHCIASSKYAYGPQ